MPDDIGTDHNPTITTHLIHVVKYQGIQHGNYFAKSLVINAPSVTPEKCEALRMFYPVSPVKKDKMSFKPGDTGYFSPKTSKNSGVTP